MSCSTKKSSCRSLNAYLAGVTPSPCVTCNQAVKFAELMRSAERLGCAYLATGHYARIVHKDARYELYRSLDDTKDQSYFLYALTQAQLSRLLFPLGESTKAQVRAEALSLGLPGATKGESQELCFVHSGQHDKFIEARAGDRIRPGRIVQGDGRLLGSHPGIHRFTIGQRKNLGVATGERSYIAAINPDTAEVVLGDRADLNRDWARLDGLQLAQDISLPCSADCMVRYRGQTQSSRLVRDDDGCCVHFDQPLAPVAPGQFAVFFHGDRVIGGGKILSAGRNAPANQPSETR